MDDIVDTWREFLGARAQVLRRDQAVDEGWFGPRVDPAVRPRIGDVVVTEGTSVVVRSKLEARLTRFIGQHGSHTPDELLVPLLVATNRD